MGQHGGAKTVDEHDIQRAQLEHSVVMDHANLQLKARDQQLKGQQMAIQAKQADDQHTLAMKTASTRPAQTAKPSGSKKSQSR